MAASPQYLASRRNASAAVTVANTNVDGTSGTRADVMLGAASGSLVESVQIKSIIAAASTVVADMVRLWYYDGANAWLIKEISVPAGGGVIGVANQEFDGNIALNLPLPTGTKLQASCHVATNGYHVTATGGDY